VTPWEHHINPRVWRIGV